MQSVRLPIEQSGDQRTGNAAQTESADSERRPCWDVRSPHSCFGAAPLSSLARFDFRYEYPK